MIGKYVIVRTYSAGCFAGVLERRDGKEVELSSARRLWYWSGASCLSALAEIGTTQPTLCKFPEPVSIAILTEAIEILQVSKVARESIEGVPVWQTE